MPKLASFRVKLVNFPSEKGRFGLLLRSLHFGSNRLNECYLFVCCCLVDILLHRVTYVADRNPQSKLISSQLIVRIFVVVVVVVVVAVVYSMTLFLD